MFSSKVTIFFEDYRVCRIWRPAPVWLLRFFVLYFDGFFESGHLLQGLWGLDYSRPLGLLRTICSKLDCKLIPSRRWKASQSPSPVAEPSRRRPRGWDLLVYVSQPLGGNNRNIEHASVDTCAAHFVSWIYIGISRRLEAEMHMLIESFEGHLWLLLGSIFGDFWSFWKVLEATFASWGLLCFDES